jgi:hypothetical protein
MPHIGQPSLGGNAIEGGPLSVSRGTRSSIIMTANAVSCVFESFREELDEHSDRKERLVKVCILYLRVCFHFQQSRVVRRVGMSQTSPRKQFSFYTASSVKTRRMSIHKHLPRHSAGEIHSLPSSTSTPVCDTSSQATASGATSAPSRPASRSTSKPLALRTTSSTVR